MIVGVFWLLFILCNWSFESFNRFTTDNSIESMMFISGIFNNSTITVSINDCVVSLYIISITCFLLTLDITGMFIMNFIVKFILSWSIFVFNMFVGWGSSRSSNILMLNWSSYNLVLNWSSNILFVLVFFDWCCTSDSSKSEDCD